MAAATAASHRRTTSAEARIPQRAPQTHCCERCKAEGSSTGGRRCDKTCKRYLCSECSFLVCPCEECTCFAPLDHRNSMPAGALCAACFRPCRFTSVLLITDGPCTPRGARVCCDCSKMPAPEQQRRVRARHALRHVREWTACGENKQCPNAKADMQCGSCTDGKISGADTVHMHTAPVRRPAGGLATLQRVCCRCFVEDARTKSALTVAFSAEASYLPSALVPIVLSYVAGVSRELVAQPPSPPALP
jgi:hypothetical protein